MNSNKQQPQDFPKLLQDFSGKKYKSADEKLVIKDCFAYTRVSTKKQEEGYSLEMQRQNCEKHAKDKGYVIHGFFGEVGESGSVRERKEYERMLDFAFKCKSKPLVILVDQPDRFSREGVYAILKRMELKEKNIYVQNVSDPIELGTEEGEEQIDANFMEVQRENRRRAKRCKKGIKAKLEAGRWPYLPPPGYKREVPAGEKKSICVIDENTAPFIRKIWEMADNHQKYDDIIKQLGLMGYKITSPKISKILRDSFYSGYYTTPLLEGRFIKGIHQPLISEELFATVNGYINKNHHGYSCNVENDTLPLKKFCKCNECGYPLTGFKVPKGGKEYYFYKCYRGCKVAINDQINSVSISMEKLHEIFLSRLQEYSIDPIHFNAIKKQLVATYQQLSEQDMSKSILLKTQLTEEKKKLETIEENYGLGKLTSDIFSKLSTKYTQSITQIEEELSQMGGNHANFEKHISKALETSCNLLKLWNLLDFSGRKRLQYLLFPNGMRFDRKKKALLTDKVNPIFYRIAQLSSTYKDEKNYTSLEKMETYGVIYNPLLTAKLFHSELCDIISFTDELNGIHPTIWKSAVYNHIDPLSGDTQVIENRYVSTTTGITQNILFTGDAVPNPGIIQLPISANTGMFLSRGGQA